VSLLKGSKGRSESFKSSLTRNERVSRGHIKEDNIVKRTRRQEWRRKRGDMQYALIPGKLKQQDLKAEKSSSTDSD